MNITAHLIASSSGLPANCRAVLSALAAKRAELDARLTQLSEQVANIEQELALLDGTMRIFAQPADLIKAPQSAPPRLRTLPDFRRGEIGEAALAVLRAAAHPLSTQEVGNAICDRYTLMLDAHTFQNLCIRVITYLRGAQQHKLVHEVGRTPQRAVLWFAPSFVDE